MPHKPTDPARPAYYTTHQVAKLFGVSLPTVVNWANAGKLVAHRTPGGHRRIAWSDLVVFARQRDIPLPNHLLDPDPQRAKRVLVMDEDRASSEGVTAFLQKDGLEVRVASTGFDAGYALVRFVPDLVLVDPRFTEPGLDGLRACIKADSALRHVVVVAWTSALDADLEGSDGIRDHVDGVIDKTMGLQRVLCGVREYLGLVPVQKGTSLG